MNNLHNLRLGIETRSAIGLFVAIDSAIIKMYAIFVSEEQQGAVMM